MLALQIISTLVLIFLWICTGIVCGRICATIIRKKDAEMNEVLWFWFGFLCQWIAVIATVVVNKKD